MNILKKAVLIGVAVAFVSVFSACEKPGPAETAGKKVDEATEDAGEAINDSGITAKVKAAILSEPGLRSLKISVSTTDEVVTLSGSVDSQKDIDKAKDVASAVSGVKRVENTLVLDSAK